MYLSLYTLHFQEKVVESLIFGRIWSFTLSRRPSVNVKRYIGATLALFVFIFLYQWVVHGMILSPFYHETPKVWREMAEMKANMPIGMLFQLLIAAWLAFVFTRLFKSGGLAKGLLFGFYFGVFMGLTTATWSLWLPVQAALGWGWFVAGLLEGIGGGAVLGLVYRK